MSLIQKVLKNIVKVTSECGLFSHVNQCFFNGQTNMRRKYKKIYSEDEQKFCLELVFLYYSYTVILFINTILNELFTFSYFIYLYIFKNY